MSWNANVGVNSVALGQNADTIEGWLCRYLKMAMMLLYERDIIGSSSRLKHYISDLEAIRIDTPVAWSENEISELQYPHLQAEIAKQKTAWNELYEAVASASSKRIQREDLYWAMQAVRSRAFSGPYSGKSVAGDTTLQILQIFPTYIRQCRRSMSEI